MIFLWSHGRRRGWIPLNRYFSLVSPGFFFRKRKQENTRKEKKRARYRISSLHNLLALLAASLSSARPSPIESRPADDCWPKTSNTTVWNARTVHKRWRPSWKKNLEKKTHQHSNVSAAVFFNQTRQTMSKDQVQMELRNFHFSIQVQRTAVFDERNVSAFTDWLRNDFVVFFCSSKVVTDPIVSRMLFPWIKRHDGMIDRWRHNLFIKEPPSNQLTRNRRCKGMSYETKNNRVAFNEKKTATKRNQQNLKGRRVIRTDLRWRTHFRSSRKHRP